MSRREQAIDLVNESTRGLCFDVGYEQAHDHDQYQHYAGI
jgi:hypothetical protein